MRYVKIVSEGYHEWGDPTYWVEVNEDGDAERQLVIYPNGKVVSYNRSHEEDEYGALGVMVIDGNEQWWEPHMISQEAFERAWASHSPSNRP